MSQTRSSNTAQSTSISLRDKKKKGGKGGKGKGGKKGY
jgi:hypothetical protein